MKEKLEECRDIVQEICCDIEGRYPIGLVRVGRLIEEMLAEWREWDDDDTAALPLWFPDEPPFPLLDHQPGERNAHPLAFSEKPAMTTLFLILLASAIYFAISAHALRDVDAHDETPQAEEVQ